MRWNMVLAISLLSFSCVVTNVEAKKGDFDPRPVLGIRVVDIAPGLEDVVGLQTHRGAYVIDGNGPPKQRSGDIPKDFIMGGDLIVGIGDDPVRFTQDLSRLVRARKPGETVKVKVLRDGETSTLAIELRGVPPLIYLPADVCPILTLGASFALDVPAVFFTGYPILGVSPSDLGGQCRNVVQACRPLQLEKQTPKRTVIDINGYSHEVAGDWRAHTHLSPDTCLEEKAKLEALRSAESN